MDLIRQFLLRSSSVNPRRNPVGVGLTLLGFCYLFLLAVPNFLFAESQSFGAVTVYTHGSLDGLSLEVTQAANLLARSPLNDPALEQRVYLTRSPREFALYSPRTPRAFGVSHLLFGSTFLSEVDPETDTVHSSASTFNVRPLSAVLAHERMHLLLAKHFGLLQTILAPAWKQEGYCGYVSGGRSVGDDAHGLQLLSAGVPGMAVAYFRDYLRVKYLLERQHLTVDQVFARSFNTAILDREASAAYTPGDK